MTANRTATVSSVAESLDESVTALEDATRSDRRWPKYTQYKPSGVDWLGDIPAHWNLKRLKYAASSIKSKDQEIDENRAYMGLEHVESWTGCLLEDAGSDYSESTGLLFEPDDVLFGKLRPYLAKAYLAPSAGMCSSEFLILRGREVAPEYLFYLVLSRGFIELVDGSTFGAKMPRANWQFVGGCMIPIPSVDEQRAIAAFLRRETGKVDALVEKKWRLIELLREKRTALISQAVTKGLNPYAPMKSSGIDWLGDVPEHWDVKRLKYVVSEPLKYGANEAAELDDPDDEEERRVLEQGDELANHRRDNGPQRLRQDDAPHDRRWGEAQRLARLRLPPRK